MIEPTPHTVPLPGSISPLPAPVQAMVARINDEYRYWSDVKYMASPVGMAPEALWQLVKAVRSKRDVEVWPDCGLHFSLTDRMQRMCHEFDLNFGGSWGAMKLFPQDRMNQELYLVSSIMEEAISSSQMEGASTTREVAKEMLRDKVAPRNRSQRMILNNYNTIQFISSRKKEPLTIELLLQVHELMTTGTLDHEGDAGRFRSHDRIVVGNGVSGEVVHRPPSFITLKDFSEKLCEFFNHDSPTVFLHPIIKGLIIHFLIAYYHPFIDGNGRTARALFYWYMLKENYWLMEYLSISRIIYRSKSRYEKSFLFTEHDGNDLGYFIMYNLEVLAKAFDGLRQYLLKKQAERNRANRFMRVDGISSRQAEIIRKFYDEWELVLTSKHVANMFGVSRVTAKAYLDSLVDSGFLQRIRPNGRSYGYIRSDKFDELTKML